MYLTLQTADFFKNHYAGTKYYLLLWPWNSTENWSCTEAVAEKASIFNFPNPYSRELKQSSSRVMIKQCCVQLQISCCTHQSCSKLFSCGQNKHQFQISCCFFFFISSLNPKPIIPAAAAVAASRVSEKSSSIIVSSMPTWLTRRGIFLINATTTPPSFPILSPSVGSLFFLVPLVDNHSTCFTPDPIHALVRRC